MALRFCVVSGIFGALSAAVLAGCGNASPALPAAPAASRGVVGRVLTAGELSGFRPSGRPVLGSSAETWVDSAPISKTQRSREEVRLEGLGFIAGVRERLVPGNGGPAAGLSIVEQFKSPSAARTELAYQVELTKASGHVTAFAVPGIPGARGVDLLGPPNSGLYVMFTDGPYYYVVGAGWPAGDPSPPTRAAVAAAAQSFYELWHA